MALTITVVSTLVTDSSEHMRVVVEVLAVWQLSAAYAAKLVMHGEYLVPLPLGRSKPPSGPREYLRPQQRA